jgi:pseudouridine-5'-phosphate glycosidase/pseudouridine kinase
MSLNIVKRLRLLQYSSSKPSLRPTPSRTNPVIASRRSHSSHNLPPRYPAQVFRVSPEVEDAVRSGKPVVALETTIYTHGFPYPDNVGLALHLESVVRLNGGIPATIGILSGVARVGLDPQELTGLASAAGKPETMKVSRRDLSYITGLVCIPSMLI